MSNDQDRTFLQLRSIIKGNGQLEVSLARVPVPQPAANEVLVRIEASPLNPSDLGLLFGPADMSKATQSGTASEPIIAAPVSEGAMKGMAARIDQSMPVGNEGAGVVVAAGSSPEAHALLGKTVAILGGAMYAQYRCVPIAQTLLLPAGTTAVEGASSFINPLTALGMVETLRHEGHKALVHTAAASNLGQMLNRLCIADGIELVNIVRKPEQAALLKKLGAKVVVNSESPTFIDELTEAIVATGATLAFDAIGGGRLASQILNAMEAALNRNATEYSRYGSSTHKQVYLYGGLDTRPTEIVRSFGMSWGIGGWLVFGFLGKLGPDKVPALKQRVAAEIKTTFASHYDREVSLAEALSLDTIAIYNQRATGTKFLVTPSKGMEIPKGL
jgi:NADPH2:quinone reductase